MSERVSVPEGEIVTRKHDVLNTIECKITDGFFNCKSIGLSGRADFDFRDVFSIDGDISVVSGGDEQIWVKPRPIGDSCALFIYERGEDDFPKGKDVKVICGIKGDQMLEAVSLWERRDLPVRPGTLRFWESMTVEEMAFYLEGGARASGGGFSHQMGLTAQEGAFSNPELWDKAKKKYPNSPYEAWRWYWDELKKKR